MNPSIIGYAAAIFLVVSLLPQLVHTYKTKKVNDLSYIFLCLQIITCILFLIYGVLLEEVPLLLANGCVLFQLVILIYFKTIYS